jgi:hypothetical protein
MPSTLEKAVKLAVTGENVEEHKQMVGGSRKVFANKKGIRGLFFFQPLIVLLRKYEICGSQICA